MPPPTKPDKSIQRAVVRGEIRKEIAGAVSSGQVRIARERGRQRRSVEKVKTNQRVRERQESEAARVAAYQQRANIQTAAKEQQRVQRLQTAKDLQAIQEAGKPSHLQEAGSSVASGVTSSSAWSTVMLITTLFFVMIFAYLIVTNGTAFGGFASKVGVFIASLSSNNPLFVSNAPTNSQPAVSRSNATSEPSNTQIS